MQVTPLALLSPNWLAVTSAFSDLSIAPLRKVDSEGLDTNDPGAYIGSISTEYASVREALRHDERILEHSFASFLVSVPSDLAPMIYDYGIHIYRQKDNYFVMSGSLHQWVDAIACMSRQPNTRKLANMIHAHFNRCLLRECFYHYKKETVDGLKVFTWQR